MKFSNDLLYIVTVLDMCGGFTRIGNFLRGHQLVLEERYEKKVHEQFSRMFFGR